MILTSRSIRQLRGDREARQFLESTQVGAILLSNSRLGVNQLKSRAGDGGCPMDRAGLLKQLSDRKLEHWQSRGLSPVKSRQLVSEKMESWKILSDEQLQEILEEEEAEY